MMYNRNLQSREVNTMSNRKSVMRKNLNAFAYYGGKFSKLKFILPQLVTPHHMYVEVCAGSAAVLLNKPCAKIEVLNDLSGEVVNFWQVLRDHRDELIQAIMDSPAGEAEFKRILTLSPSNDDVEMARRFFVHIVQVFSCMPSKQYHSFGRVLLYKKETAQKNLTEVADRMRNVVVENTTASRLITRLANNHRKNKQSILFYADPPYTADSRKGTDVYIHDDFSHEEFLGTITAAPAFCKFAVSGYDNELYNNALADWHREELETQLVARNTSGRRTEVLWRNYKLEDPVQLF